MSSFREPRGTKSGDKRVPVPEVFPVNKERVPGLAQADYGTSQDLASSRVSSFASPWEEVGVRSKASSAAAASRQYQQHQDADHNHRSHAHSDEVHSILYKWLRENLTKPYPSIAEKKRLAAKTKLRYRQVSYWYTNARRRLVPKMIDAENKRRAESGLVALKVETFTLATGTSSGSSSSDVTQCKVGDLALSPATTSASSGILCSPGDIPQTQALATTPHLSDHHHKTIPLSRDYGHDVSSSSSRSGSLFAATPTSPTVPNTYTTVICSTTKDSSTKRRPMTLLPPRQSQGLSKTSIVSTVPTPADSCDKTPVHGVLQYPPALRIPMPASVHTSFPQKDQPTLTAGCAASNTTPVLVNMQPATHFSPTASSVAESMAKITTPVSATMSLASESQTAPVPTMQVLSVLPGQHMIPMYHPASSFNTQRTATPVQQVRLLQYVPTSPANQLTQATMAQPPHHLVSAVLPQQSLYAVTLPMSPSVVPVTTVTPPFSPVLTPRRHNASHH